MANIPYYDIDIEWLNVPSAPGVKLYPAFRSLVGLAAKMHAIEENVQGIDSIIASYGTHLRKACRLGVARGICKRHILHERMIRHHRR